MKADSPLGLSPPNKYMHPLSMYFGENTMTTRFEHDKADNLTRVNLNEQSGPCDPTECNLVTEYHYDKANRLTAIIDPQGRESRSEYDALSRVERSIVNYQDGVYDPAQPDADLITGYAYDANGNPVSTFDTLGRESRSEYDALNRAERSIVNYQDGVYDPARPDEDLITRYSYDPAGNQTTIIDPLGRLTSYSYDDLNRVKTITNPLGGVTSYSYDPAGNSGQCLFAVVPQSGNTRRLQAEPPITRPVV